ncbi:hypothetical protein GCM10027160_07910 [Streptomyces calidiresistens]
MVQQRAARGAREHALAVLRVRNRALAAAMAPAAAGVVLLSAVATDWLPPVLAVVGWVLLGVGALTLALAAALAAVIARARPPVTPMVPLPEHAAPDLHRLIRGLADRLEVPAPAAVALTPDCDSWLEEPPRRGPDAAPGPILVIGSPFLWWMRVDELRALLAPVVAGTGPAAQPDIAAARRCLRGWDAASVPPSDRTPLRCPLHGVAARLSRLLLRAAGPHAAEMERGVATAASERARSVDHHVRLVAREQVGLAYAGWDRLLTRVILPAWRAGRRPTALNAGVVAALTELSRRDRLAGGPGARLGERPACDLLDEPGAVDAEVSLLAARIFHGTPAPGGGWAPVSWETYPREVTHRLWRDRAERLFGALEGEGSPTLAGVLRRLSAGGPEAAEVLAARVGAALAREEAARPPAEPPVQPLDVPSTGRELLVEHITAAVCCAAVETTDAAPGLDWLDGPILTRPADGSREAVGAPSGDGAAASVGRDLTGSVQRLVDEGDPGPLRTWLGAAGVRADRRLRVV